MLTFNWNWFPCWCYGDDGIGVGWGEMLTFNWKRFPCWCYSDDGVGVGWGEMLTFNWKWFPCWCYGDDGVLVGWGEMLTFNWNDSNVAGTVVMGFGLGGAGLDVNVPLDMIRWWGWGEGFVRCSRWHCWQGLDRNFLARLHNKKAETVQSTCGNIHVLLLWRYHWHTQANLLVEIAKLA